MANEGILENFRIDLKSNSFFFFGLNMDLTGNKGCIFHLCRKEGST